MLAKPRSYLDADQNRRPLRSRPHDQHGDRYPVQRPQDRPAVAEGELIQERVGKEVDNCERKGSSGVADPLLPRCLTRLQSRLTSTETSAWSSYYLSAFIGK
jgi:hypothetical protein